MKKINGLPGIGSAGKIGNKGANGINVYASVYTTDDIDDVSNKKENNSFYIDKYFNKSYINNSSTKEIFNSFFYDIDVFDMEVIKDTSIIFTEGNLLLQKNIFSKTHREKILPNINYKLILLNDNNSVEEEDSDFLTLSKKLNTDINLNLKNEKDKFTFNSERIILDSSIDVYYYSKEQSVLKHIKDNFYNLFNVTSISFIDNDKNYKGFKIYLNGLLNYLITEYTINEIIKNLKIEFIRSDNKGKQSYEETLKNFNEDIYELYTHRYILDLEEYNYSYYLKIILKDNYNNNIYSYMLHITDEVKNKPNINDETYTTNEEQVYWDGKAENINLWRIPNDGNELKVVYRPPFDDIQLSDTERIENEETIIGTVVDDTDYNNTITEDPNLSENFGEHTSQLDGGGGSGGYMSGNTIIVGLETQLGGWGNQTGGWGNQTGGYGGQSNTVGYKPGWSNNSAMNTLLGNNRQNNLLITSTNNRYK